MISSNISLQPYTFLKKGAQKLEKEKRMSDTIKEFTQTSKYNSEIQSKKIKIYCSGCKTKTQHSILSSTKLKTTFKDYLDNNIPIETWLLEEYQTIQCRGCEDIHFRHTHIFSEEIWQHNQMPHEHLYPSQNQTRDTMKKMELLPSSLIDIYIETVETLNSNLLILSGVGIRAIVETICKDKAVSGKNLKQKIDNLVTKEILTPSDAETLHIFRDLGNDAVHELKPHTAKQLGIALDVLEHLMTGLYILPHGTTKHFSNKYNKT
jgi:hypothetical protein